MQDAKDSTNRKITEYLYSRLDGLLMLENRFTAILRARAIRHLLAFVIVP